MNENREDDAIEKQQHQSQERKGDFSSVFCFASRLNLKISENLNEIGDENKQAAHSIIQRTSIQR